MADGMGSAWVPPKRPLRKPPLQAGRMLDIQASMDLFTKRLAAERSGDFPDSAASYVYGYRAALDDLRRLVNLGPIEGSK
jgi:hypothetical protein